MKNSTQIQTPEDAMVWMSGRWIQFQNQMWRLNRVLVYTWRRRNQRSSTPTVELSKSKIAKKFQLNDGQKQKLNNLDNFTLKIIEPDSPSTQAMK